MVPDGSSVEGHAVQEQPALQRLPLLLLSVGVEGPGEGAAAAEETRRAGEENAAQTAGQVSASTLSGLTVLGLRTSNTKMSVLYGLQPRFDSRSLNRKSDSSSSGENLCGQWVITACGQDLVQYSWSVTSRHLEGLQQRSLVVTGLHFWW